MVKESALLSEGKPTPLSPGEALRCLEAGAAILDIRPVYETNYREFDFPDVFMIPVESYQEQYPVLPRNKPVIVVDSVGLHGREAAQFLAGQGYERTGYVVGGIIAWEQAGLPLKKDMQYQMVGECGCSVVQKERPAKN